MLGSEHKKERVSERLQGLNNQPRHRGYLPGCHTRAADVDGRTAYSVKTLQGNWAEERRDVGYSEDKPVISTDLESQWQTTYGRMVKEGTSGAQLKPANRVNQKDLVEIVDGRNQCFPGHQPIQDPTYKEAVANTHHTTTSTTFRNPRDVQRAAKEYVPPVLGGSPDAQPRAVILRARHKLLLQSDGSFAGIRRTLKVMDTTGDGRLNHKELQAGLARYNIPLSDAETTVLLKYFDKDGGGDISIDEFVRGLRGTMTDRRLDLVKKAYALLDANCEGVVRLDDIIRLFDASQHPDVKSGKFTPTQSLQRFASQWSANGDDVIEFAEFRDYYEDVSSVIDNEQQFELMMRNAWHLSGGEGICQNTSCRRVIVTHTTGRQTAQEIKNDLGIGPADLDKMILNLRAQGITDVARVELQ
eukprot:GILI01018170.1.p1 GENE.GILI01018170.1~~GILI01018170.1.p1  ORF type:complete len:415 (+),score=103.01 GILI01018170.1:74-1318(+)